VPDCTARCVPDYAGAFRAIGPAAIKLGQTLATRPDIIGVEPARNLLTLQDQLPPAAFELVYAEIDTSLNKPAAELFEYIDPVAVGAASIAQVYRARTTEGKDVAVKVPRHPRAIRARYRHL
jgi:ubiquinone biosynthesis protein